MSTKDYVAIANILDGLNATEIDSGLKVRNVLLRVQGSIGDYFAKDNPRFDRDKFNAACNVTHNSIVRNRNYTSRHTG